MELVEEISPGIISKHLASISDESIYPTGNYSNHHDRDMYQDYDYNNYSSHHYPLHDRDNSNYYYPSPSPSHHDVGYLHNNSIQDYDNIDREWDRNVNGSWKGGNN